MGYGRRRSEEEWMDGAEPPALLMCAGDHPESWALEEDGGWSGLVVRERGPGSDASESEPAPESSDSAESLPRTPPARAGR